ncbi:YitT family protein [Litorivicinus lipolyticus]|uniref:YitT family protein n=1 Tax=Litorivicinus lipolyticus TaxID=418701 RepID=UPI003B5C315C
MEPIKLNPTDHRVWEDLFGIAIGVTLCGLGLLIFRDLGLTVGGTAGLALLVHYGTGLSLGLSYSLINLPFYAFAWVKMGWAFTLRTLITVTLLSVGVEWAASMIQFSRLDPLLGTWVAGVLVGMGLLSVFRHGSSFGGSGILAAFLQDHFGIKAGYVQLAFDSVVLLVAFLMLEPSALAYSVVSALILNGLVAVNHNRARYVGVT